MWNHLISEESWTLKEHQCYLQTLRSDYGVRTEQKQPAWVWFHVGTNRQATTDKWATTRADAKTRVDIMAYVWHDHLKHISCTGMQLYNTGYLFRFTKKLTSSLKHFQRCKATLNKTKIPRKLGEIAFTVKEQCLSVFREVNIGGRHVYMVHTAVPNQSNIVEFHLHFVLVLQHLVVAPYCPHS